MLVAAMSAVIAMVMIFAVPDCAPVVHHGTNGGHVTTNHSSVVMKHGKLCHILVISKTLSTVFEFFKL